MASGSKSASAFRTISEAAKELDLPQHVLRFWETKFNQIRPLKRGGGRRYYRPEDIKLLQKIRGLLYDSGYTIKGVQKLLKDGIPDLAVAANTENATQSSTSNSPVVNNDEDLRGLLNELQEIKDLLHNSA